MDGRSEQDQRDADDVTEADAHGYRHGASEEPAEAEAHGYRHGASEEPAEAEAHGLGSPLGSDEAPARREPGARR